MDAMMAVLDEGNGFAPPLLGALWRASIAGVLFFTLVWGICRLVPRLPAQTRFWLWWMVSAKLLLGLAYGASALPVMSPFVLRLPDQHPAAAPAFFVARLVVQPTRLLYRSGERGAIPARTKPAIEKVGKDAIHAPDAATVRKEEVLPHASRNTGNGRVMSAPLRLAGPWYSVAWAALLLWCAGFLLRLARMAKGVLDTQRTLRMTVSASEAVQQEARIVARLMGLRRCPPVLIQDSALSPFLVGFLRPAIVLPDPGSTMLSTAELRMALAHELTHLRRGDLWLAIIPLLAEAAFFFLPIARWTSRECDICREEVCDSAAVTHLGSDLLADYGQLLMKVTLAAQTGRPPAPQMGMAVTASPAFVQLRRRLNALKNTVSCPASPHLRRSAALLLAVCLPGVLPWHLRALPRSAAAEPVAPEDAARELPQYTVVDLGTLGGKFSEAYGIGENGVVVGTANVFPLGGRGHAFLWRPDSDDALDGVMTDLCAGSIFRHSLAYSVNEKGQVAAAAFNNPLKPNAFLWTPGGVQRRYLGGLPGFRFSRATDINNAGTIVGTALGAGLDRRGAVRMRAFSWRNGRIQDLGTLGGDFSSAAAISEYGHIAGKSDTGSISGGSTHAVLWEPEDAKPRDIGTLPGGSNSAASAVNSRGEVVGFSETFDTPRHAFVYTDGSLEDLGALPPAEPDAISISAAGGINDAGWIVGFSSSLPSSTVKNHREGIAASRAVVWLPVKEGGNRRHLIDLNDCLIPGVGWSLESARAINNQGEIVGVGLIDGKRHAFLLRPANRENKAPYSSRSKLY